jgi:hypothetical protein
VALKATAPMLRIMSKSKPGMTSTTTCASI